MILLLPLNFSKKYQNYQQSHIWSKISFLKKLSDLIETLAYYYQIPYSKNVKVWTKLEIFLLNKTFIRILILFCTTPYVIRFPFIYEKFSNQANGRHDFLTFKVDYSRLSELNFSYFIDTFGEFSKFKSMNATKGNYYNLSSCQLSKTAKVAILLRHHA